MIGLHERRAEIWNDWLDLTAALMSAVHPVAAAWVSGSFFTNKPEPGDLDCVYLIDVDALEAARLDSDKATFLQVVGTSAVSTVFGLKVDSFILTWVPTAGPGRPASAEAYLSNRGYGDDLWSRDRDTTDARLDALPRRGYLEVSLDGYS